MTIIKDILAREILDSRGNPTVEVDVVLDSGEVGRASVPSGASTGTREAVELRDNDKNRYLGKGVLKAIQFIRSDIAKNLRGFNPTAQQEIDDVLINLDGTRHKEHLGANAILAVSLAVAKSAAKSRDEALYQYLNWGRGYLLPVPMMNIINGGVHADNRLDFQEFMVLPVGALTFSEALRMGAEIFHHLRSLLKAKQYNTNVGDEGGFAPDLPSHEAAIEFILEAIIKTGLRPRDDVYVGIDVASTEFYKDGHYHLNGENKILSPSDFISYLQELVKKYPIISIEDGLAENDWKHWEILTEKLGKQIQLVGDDLFVTQLEYLEKGIKNKVANAILIKPNQVGTLTETIAAITLAQESKYNTVVSHRSGETEDTTIADLAVGMNAGQIKTGSLCRTDRVAKYNQLLRIEESLRSNARYAGKSVFQKFESDMSEAASA